jgi:CubicO group peptidase (beta-lactamase class C family)
VTLREVLEHRSGLSAAETSDDYKPPDSVRFALAADVEEDPGSKYAFNPSALSLVAGVVQAASGKRIDHYLSDELIAPLGLAQPVWTYDQEQTPLVATGVSWRASDLARLGAAFIDGAQERFFSKAWRAAADAPSATDANASLVWHLRPIANSTALYASDPGGSFILLLPERRLVAVRLTEGPLKASQASLDALLAALFPESKKR